MKRKEDLRVLLAKTEYLDDINLPGLLHLGFYRSPYAHARIRNIDTSELKQDSRVVDCITGKDISGSTNPMPFITAPTGCLKPAIYPLALGKVRFVGEPVAAAVVSDRYSLEDVLENLNADFEILPPVRSIEDAANGTTRLYEDWDSNVAYKAYLEHGEVDRAVKEAHTVISEKFEIGRQYGACMETRGVIADYDESDDVLTVRSSTQWPHFVSRLLAETINHPENKLRVIAPDVGGGFGNKQDFYREEVVVSQMAKKLRRPIKWVASRREDMSSTVHSRDQIHRARIALSREGKILGMSDEILADLGAYGPMSLGPATTTFISMTGPYDIQNLRLEMSCLVTSRVPTGAYRGFGQPEAAFVLERLLDLAAQELSIDKAEIRRRNIVRHFPYNCPTGRILDSGDYLRMLDRGLELSEYDSIKTRMKGTSGEKIGIGISFGFEGTGLGPSRIQDLAGARHKGYDSVTLRILPDGKATILTGLSPHGQGLETTLSQLCADFLGIDLEGVRVVRGDTLTSPYGHGTWGIRSAVLGAGALLKCVEKVKQKMIAITANKLQTDKELLEFKYGAVYSRESKEPAYTLQTLARMAFDDESLPQGAVPGFEATANYEPSEFAVAGGFHVVAVAIDPETLMVRVLKYVVVHDCGLMLNPLIVEGQLQGGIAQGIGGALLEEVSYDQDAQLQTTTLMDYLIPSAVDVPDFELAHTVTPSPSNTLGIKGMGESGIIGPAAAINNAICDAMGLAMKLNRTPVNPAELWTKIAEIRTEIGPIAER
jgi:carbon-monoxide dehydrogenase large subunit